MKCSGCDRTADTLVVSPELGESVCAACAEKARLLALRRDLRSANKELDVNLHEMKQAVARTAAAKLEATLERTPLGRALLDFAVGRVERIRKERRNT